MLADRQPRVPKGNPDGGQFASSTAAGQSVADEPETWKKFPVDTSKTYELYHVTTDASNLAGITSEGFVPGKTSANLTTPGNSRTYFHLNREAAEIFFDQMVASGGSPALIRLSVPGRQMALADPRWDALDDNDSAVALLAGGRFKNNIVDFEMLPSTRHSLRGVWKVRAKVFSRSRAPRGPR